MFSFSLRASLTTLIASAVAVSASPSLSVKTSTPNVNVDGLENLKVTTTIINTGDEPLELLNHPLGVLGPFPENAFIVTNPAGSRPLFDDAKIGYSPTYAAGLDGPSVFTVLAAGDSINITHDLSAAFDFTRSGAGNYSIEPSNLFTYIDVHGILKDLYATVVDIAEVRLSGSLTVSRVLDKRGATINCSEDQKLRISLAVILAQIYAAIAETYLDRIDDRNPPRVYTTWFGRYSFFRKSIAQETFRQMAVHPFSNITYICDCNAPDTPALHDPSNPGWIYLCPTFWSGTPKFKALCLIHQSSHFDYVGATKHHAMGRDECKALAASFIEEALANSDSYMFFAEATSEPSLDEDKSKDPDIAHDELRRDHV